MSGTGTGVRERTAPQDRLREHHRRCLPALSRLRLVARSGLGTGVDVRAATAEVMAELSAAEAVLLDTMSESVRREALAHFLACRVNRLTIVAEHAAATASAGDLPVLRRLLYQFHALAEAMWKVQLGLQRPEPRPAAVPGADPRPRRTPQRRPVARS
ncbi:hypothetical protein [Actinomadura sp. WMMA1423]|uniref:hypothetical protein n=1 Tax=Actinomadura sp. WMMA1423 TaxID=2591108 RepID=UPI00114721A2|nr:hypothetical protein [Actinomadura sp. WMMA1423]